MARYYAPAFWGAIWIIVAVGTAADAAAPEPVATVAVSVEDPQGVFSAILSRAQAVATGIYRDAGVNLRWAAGPRAAENALRMIALESTFVRLGSAGDAMGVALSPGDGTRGTTAYLLIDRIIAFAEANHLPLWAVLGCVLAHEIGHLLLPPNAHTPHSIMQAEWRRSDFPPRRPGIVGFASAQARLLRLRATSR